MYVSIEGPCSPVTPPCNSLSHAVLGTDKTEMPNPVTCMHQNTGIHFTHGPEPQPQPTPTPCSHRYKEVVETVLRFKDSKEKQIRRAVIVLLPRMAAFSPERFAYEYLAKVRVDAVSCVVASSHEPWGWSVREG